MLKALKFLVLLFVSVILLPSAADLQRIWTDVSGVFTQLCSHQQAIVHYLQEDFPVLWENFFCVG